MKSLATKSVTQPRRIIAGPLARLLVWSVLCFVVFSQTLLAAHAAELDGHASDVCEICLAFTSDDEQPFVTTSDLFAGIVQQSNPVHFEPIFGCASSHRGATPIRAPPALAS